MPSHAAAGKTTHQFTTVVWAFPVLAACVGSLVGTRLRAIESRECQAHLSCKFLIGSGALAHDEAWGSK